MPAEVVVIGGGLSGISAALDLADAGQVVTLLEARPRLGGAAFSFTRGELTIDNGQHIFLRCCEAYRSLLSRLGADDMITVQPALSVPVLSPSGRSARLARTPHLPAPLHLVASLARYGLLSPADRLRAVRGALAMRRLDPADPELDTRTFGEFLTTHGQTQEVLDALWGVLVTATLNIDPAQASLALAAKVFRTGLLDRADAADVGHAVVPLGRIHNDLAHAALSAAGVEVCTQTKVLEVKSSPSAEGSASAFGNPVVRIRDRRGDRTLSPDAVVLALPHAAARGVAVALARGSLSGTAALGASPIVNVHVIYDRPVTDLPFAAAVNSPVHWVFDRTDSAGVSDRRWSGPKGSQYLAVTVSAADAIAATPAARLREVYQPALAELFPAARRAAVVDFFVTRERQATFRQGAGTAALRPNAASGLDGVSLAGAWTSTGWPDTMESAVLSGEVAAMRLLSEIDLAADSGSAHQSRVSSRFQSHSGDQILASTYSTGTEDSS